MKLLLLPLAAAAIASASAADLPACQPTNLKALMENANLPLCITKSGVVFSLLTTTPTDAQLAKMCSTSECVALLRAILAVDPADCKVPTDGAIALRSQLIDPAVAYCEKSGVVVTAARAGSGSSGGSNSTVGTVKPADSTSTSAPSSSVPTASPTSDAAAAAVGSAAFVMAATVAVAM